MRKPTQMELLKSASRRRSSDIEIDTTNDGRRLPPIDDGPELDMDEPLGELNQRMNMFQREIGFQVQQDDERLKFMNQWKIRTYSWIFVLSMIVTIVIVIAISIAISVKRGHGFKNSRDYSNSWGNIFFNIDQCYSSTAKDLDRYQNFRSILISIDPNMAHTIDAPYRSSSIALCWLSHHDSLYLTPTLEYQLEIRERFVLAMIFFSFVDSEEFSNDFHIFSGRKWLSPTHVCNWDLVQCDDTFGGSLYISGLYLSKIPLQRLQPIPTEIALLTNLTKLYFYPREMLGPIPSQLWNLTKLEEFSVAIISENNDVGDMNGLEKLSELQFLALQANYHGRLPHLTTLQQLTRLELYDPNSNITSEFPDLHTLTNLESLVVRVPFHASISQTLILNLTKLESLQISMYRATIPTEIQFLTSLTHLKFFQASGTIPTEIGLLENLVDLTIVGETLFGTIPSEIGMLNHLENLHLADCDVVLSNPFPFEVCKRVANQSLYLEIESALDNPGC